jgi:hypothetical protein
MHTSDNLILFEFKIAFPIDPPHPPKQILIARCSLGWISQVASHPSLFQFEETPRFSFDNRGHLCSSTL